MSTYEMLWDCAHCGAQKNLGLTHRHCPTCGSQQDPGRRYYPADDQRVAVEDHVFVGTDVRCAYCQTAASRAATCCPGCGAPLAEGADVGRRAEQAARAGLAAESVEDAVRERAAAAQAAPPPASGPRGKGKLVAIGCAGLLAVACVLSAAAIFWKQGGALTVSGHAWTREIQIERFGPVDGSAWCDAVPPAARVRRRAREVHHRDRVADGQNCQTVRQDNGDGTYTEREECAPRFRDEPVYAEKCYYQVDAWAAARTETSRGGLAEAPAWPVVALAGTGQCVGCEREGTRTERYVVTFSEEGSRDVHECEFDQARWATFASGSRWKGDLGVLAGGLDCGSLSAP